MLSKFAKCVPRVGRRNRGNKTPYPTTFSNSRSQLYLNSHDIENLTPNRDCDSLQPPAQPPALLRSHPSVPTLDALPLQLTSKLGPHSGLPRNKPAAIETSLSVERKRGGPGGSSVPLTSTSTSTLKLKLTLKPFAADAHTLAGSKTRCYQRPPSVEPRISALRRPAATERAPFGAHRMEKLQQKELSQADEPDLNISVTTAESHREETKIATTQPRLKLPHAIPTKLPLQQTAMGSDKPKPAAQSISRSQSKSTIVEEARGPNQDGNNSATADRYLVQRVLHKL
jgi:hypothetical protein